MGNAAPMKVAPHTATKNPVFPRDRLPEKLPGIDGQHHHQGQREYRPQEETVDLVAFAANVLKGCRRAK